MKKYFSLLVLLAAFGAGCASSAPVPAPTPTPAVEPTPAPVTPTTTADVTATTPSGWHTYTNDDAGFQIAYPLVPQQAVDIPQQLDDVFGVNIGTAVASTTAESVPTTEMHIKVVAATSTRLQNCYYAEQGWENGAPVRQEKITIDNREFCLRVDMDAGAGNRYNTFAYATKVGEKTVVISFTVHSVACENYPDPATQCVGFMEARDTERFPQILQTFATTR